MKARLWILLTLVLVPVAIMLPRSGEASETIQSDELIFSGDDFEIGLRDNLQITAEGLTLTPSSLSGQYISPIIRTHIPFNALVPRWIANVPYDNTLKIMMRTGVVGQEWGEWLEVHENHDWMIEGDEEIIGQMIGVPAEEQTHNKLQYAVLFNRYSFAPPSVLKQIGFSMIDSSAGPTTEEMLAMVSEPEGVEVPGRYPRPAVIPRTIWCTDPACNYSNGLQYESVSHLVVHHTVSNNSSSDWAAIVRAIWYFHTFSRGWGDIGYNYLVDQNGVLYEGHLGGDDVVGTHAAGANAGSLGLALIGTFTEPDQSPPGIEPPQPMLNSAANLLAWKADQKNIDVFSASRLPNVAWGLPNLMGHRDVYGTTACPGDQAQDLLPWLRQEVASRIGFVSPHIYIDEMSGAFTKSSSSAWHTGPNDCGFNGHAYYAWSTTNAGSSDIWGEWRPNIVDSGIYELEVYAPFCLTGESETNGARYTINHANGTDTVSVSHENNLGTWMSLGNYYFSAGTSGSIRLTNITSTDSGRGVWFVAIRLRPTDPNFVPEITLATPAWGSWKHDRTVNFQWDIQNAMAVKSTTIRMATDIAFNNEILIQTFTGARTSFAHTFTQDYETIFWFVVTRTHDDRLFGSAVHPFG
ncbi:MAG: N-acetylmuramoyl-L-alanine amidase, partial [Candidatus Promineifilaceae bacterium]